MGRQLDLWTNFAGDLSKPKIKSNRDFLERNWFVLGKKDVRTKIEHVWKDGHVRIATAGKSLATIFDNDILLYLISNIRARMDGGETGLLRGHTFSIYDYLLFTDPNLRGRKTRKNEETTRIQKRTSGEHYARTWDALNRLADTIIETNIRAGGMTYVNKFALVPSIKKIERNGKTVGIHVEISDWLAQRISDDQNILTLFDENYFQIKSGLARWLYLWARKSCGRQSLWKERIESVWTKSASAGTLKKFKQLLVPICKKGLLDEYNLEIDGDFLVVTRTTSKLIKVR